MMKLKEMLSTRRTIRRCLIRSNKIARGLHAKIVQSTHPLICTPLEGRSATLAKEKSPSLQASCHHLNGKIQTLCNSNSWKGQHNDSTIVEDGCDFLQACSVCHAISRGFLQKVQANRLVTFRSET